MHTVAKLVMEEEEASQQQQQQNGGDAEEDGEGDMAVEEFDHDGDGGERSAPPSADATGQSAVAGTTGTADASAEPPAVATPADAGSPRDDNDDDDKDCNSSTHKDKKSPGEKNDVRNVVETKEAEKGRDSSTGMDQTAAEEAGDESCDLKSKNGETETTTSTNGDNGGRTLRARKFGNVPKLKNGANSNVNVARKRLGKNNTGGSSASVAPDGSDTLDRLIEEAKYELIDPYRGMLQFEGNYDPDRIRDGDDESQHFPWRKCQVGSSPLPPVTGASGDNKDSSIDLVDSDIDDDSDSPERQLVRRICQSSCPRLADWTAEQAQERLKKQKQRKQRGKRGQNQKNDNDGDGSLLLGRRPGPGSKRCSCDYNPFCLLTLGGAMDDVLARQCQRVSPKSDPSAASSSAAVTGNAKNDSRMSSITTASVAASNTAVVNGDAKNDSSASSIPTASVETRILHVKQLLSETLQPPPTHSAIQLYAERFVAAGFDSVEAVLQCTRMDLEDKIKMEQGHILMFERAVASAMSREIRVLQVKKWLSESLKPSTTEAAIQGYAERFVDEGFDSVEAILLHCKRQHLEDIIEMTRAHIMMFERAKAQVGGIAVDNDDVDDVVVCSPADRGWPPLPKRFDPSDTACIYRDATKDKLKRMRKSTWVESERIVGYLAKTLQALTEACPPNRCLERLRARNKELIFFDPCAAAHQSSSGNHCGTDIHDDRGSNTSVDKDAAGSMIQLSMPPGIENLGATCYLNTQLQCLAQNLSFIRGIFSWTGTSNKDDKMESVLSLFQQLMADLKLGPSSKVIALEFANALGLEHYEQQDPNEFSRLFFTLLDDSFKQKANAGTVAEAGGGITCHSPENDLSRLLPDIFEGKLEYETKCLKCSKASRREEPFMDLNLPIVRPSADDCEDDTGAKSKKKQKNGILCAAWQAIFSSSTSGVARQTDVQYCLDKYFQEEYLEGDDQYLCDRCNAKCDAVRRTSLKRPPSVLNIQLSRYVYDREKGMKKKLSDKVLLPLELLIQAKDDEDVHSRRYRLCAVMRHQGTSAYSGHYVAEAMDWLTGVWFEFNDERVSVLEKGPSCSYDPAETSLVSIEEAATGSREKSKPQQGSADAYNMYYVDEDFLAHNVFETLHTDDKKSISGEEQAVENVINQVAEKRKIEYTRLSR